MSHMYKMILPLVLLVAVGCDSAKSNRQFTQGTIKLIDGNYEKAIVHLEKAVAYAPHVSRNQNNLACAYWQVGEIEKAWIHSRKAIRADLENRYATEFFLVIYDEMSLKYGIKDAKLSEAELIVALGEPDERLNSLDGKQTSLIFGGVAFEYEEGVFRGRRWLPPYSERNFSY